MPRFELFAHDADIGVRGFGAGKSEAFEQVALALSAIVTNPSAVSPSVKVEIECEAPSDQLLLADWLNRLIYEMAVRHVLFGRYEVTIENGRLRGLAWGEELNPTRHAPAVEPKGATLTELKVEPCGEGWVAQCVIDV